MVRLCRIPCGKPQAYPVSFIIFRGSASKSVIEATAFSAPAFDAIDMGGLLAIMSDLSKKAAATAPLKSETQVLYRQFF